MTAESRPAIAIPADGETIAVHCHGLDCHHGAVILASRFRPGLSGPQMERSLRLVCHRCGSRSVGVMRDMLAHYARINAETGWSGGGGEGLPKGYRVVGRDVPWPEIRQQGSE